MGTMTNNVFPSLHLLESIRRLGLPCRIHLAGSSEEYGSLLSEELPVKETNALRPLNPYATSKVAMSMFDLQYFKAFDLTVIRTRSFNHIGPARHKLDATNEWAKQLVMIQKGFAEPVLRVGNLSVQRDFLDVRDVVKAYWLAATRGEPGEVYNICSGREVALQEVLALLLQNIPIQIRVEQDPAKFRPSDVSNFVGDSSKFRKMSGWEPQISLHQSLRDTLDFWQRVAKESPVSG